MRLHQLVIGTGEHPVVFLHGLLGQGRNFNTIAKKLTALRPELRCHLLDLPNHGRSPWTEEFSYPQLADAVAEHLVAEQMGHPAVVGHSLGGKVAMQLALRHPELAERLLIEDSTIAPRLLDQQTVAAIRAGASLELDELKSREDAQQKLSSEIPNEAVRNLLLANLTRTETGFTWRANLILFERSLGEIAAWPDTTGQYSQPVLWVTGEHSNRVEDSDREELSSYFPKLRRTVIRDAGHWVHADAPEAFIGVLCSFL